MEITLKDDGKINGIIISKTDNSASTEDIFNFCCILAGTIEIDGSAEIKINGRQMKIITQE